MDGCEFAPELIIHAGDLTGDDYLHGLECIAPTLAVRGNMDGDYQTGRLPDSIEDSIEGWSIGIMHGRGSPASVPDFVRSQFNHADLVIFGHSHIPYLENKGKTVYLNPGSLNLPRHGGTGTFAVIDLNIQELQCKILTLSGSKTLEIARFSRKRSI